MNAMFSPFGPNVADKAANTLAAARALSPHLARSRALDRKLVSTTMTLCFGDDDAAGAWNWRDAYDAVELAIVLQLRRLAPQLERLEDAPAQIVGLLHSLNALTLTHTRRSEEQVALDQFSTPPALAAVAVLAAQIRPGDRVLEPSAGTGLLAVIAEACGASLELNEIAPHRAGLLDLAFPRASRSRHDAAHLADLLPSSGSFHAVVTNPPYQHVSEHLMAALDCLADGGRLCAIVPVRLFEDTGAVRVLGARGAIIAKLAFPARAFEKHGTSVDTGLLVIDRAAEPAAEPVGIVLAQSLDELALAASRIAPRPTAQARRFRILAPSSILPVRSRRVGEGSRRFGFLSGASAIAYDTRDDIDPGKEVGLYQSYQVARLKIPGAQAHPSPLVEAAAMATVQPPKPTYRPVLPPEMLNSDRLSDAQMETIIYAGEAHGALLPGRWLKTDNPHIMQLAAADAEAVIAFRRGFFLGDGTGLGKGRQIAGVIADNIAQGRARAVWLSKNDPLLDDARRDWTAIGGDAAEIVPQSAWKQGEAITMDRGILFTTYATLRQPARQNRPSRLDQIVAWLGEAFDGVIAFDEAHALANAGGGTKGARGILKASQQGIAGLALQNRLPNARIFYVSATGATRPENLAYASRLGLWGGPDAPFFHREHFLEACEAGGVAVMELIARELKAMGLYIARSLSFEGVEYEAINHELTAQDTEIWNSWADAYQIIHANLIAALAATGRTDDDGGATAKGTKSAALSAFASCQQRFFGGLLAGIKAPTLIGSIRQDLAGDRSAVVQIVTTNEAVMERKLAEIPPEEWNNLTIDLSPKDQVLDYLMNAFPVHAMTTVEDADGNVTLIAVTNDGAPVFSQAALALREALVEHLACLPAVAGVLDALLEAFGTDMVAEITGRSRRVVNRDGRRVLERRGANAARTETDAFMSGKKRVLIFSDAGGTGRSYHADLACRNIQRRRHYLAEPGWRADAAIQGLGRSHRTNQAVPPLFTPVTTNIHGEKRFLSTIARRLDSLGALTRGERRAASNGLFRAEDNLESPWAHRALIAFYRALIAGDVEGWSFADFARKTALSLVDNDGCELPVDQLPPMHTFLNRLLALRIDDQNTLFATFDTLLRSILERATQSGLIDKGVEDIIPAKLDVISAEVLRSDAATGAQTRLMHLKIKDRHPILTSEAALKDLGHLPSTAYERVINGKSGRAGIVVRGLTTTDDSDHLIKAVRLIRPDAQGVTAEHAYGESSWEAADDAIWRATWDAEVLATDPYKTRDIYLATGVLLPIWRHLPKTGAWVRRVKAPDGRRWLGRTLLASDVAQLRTALGLTTTATAAASPGVAEAMILKEGAEIRLSGGLWLRRARVMDRMRIELVGSAPGQRETFKALGLQVEIIAYTPRLFCPVGGAALAKLLTRHPAEQILTAA